jgi:hypothetical protein
MVQKETLSALQGGEGGEHCEPGEVGGCCAARCFPDKSARTPPHPEPLRPHGAERGLPCDCHLRDHSAVQFSIQSVLGYWWPVGVTPLSHWGMTNALARKYSGSTGSSSA